MVAELVGEEGDLQQSLPRPRAAGYPGRIGGDLVAEVIPMLCLCGCWFVRT